MSWGTPLGGNGTIVKLGDPKKEGFQTEAQGVYLGSRPGDYANLLHDFATPDGQITIPGSAALDTRLGGQLKGTLLKLVYEGDVTTKKGKTMKKINVIPWQGPLPDDYAQLVAQANAEALSEVPEALGDDEEEDEIPF